MRRRISTVCWSFAFLFVVGSTGADEDAELSSAWSRAGRSIKDATVETGHAIRDTAKTAGHEARFAAKKVSAATRETREDAAAEGRSFWSGAKHKFANAVDYVSGGFEQLKTPSK
jgi:hypothetical protein